MNKNFKKKGKKQLSYYKLVLKNSDSESTTELEYNKNLRGSNDIVNDSNDLKEDKIADKPLNYKILDYFKNNWRKIITTFFVLIIIPLLLWLFKEYVQLRIETETKINLMEYQIEKIEDSIDDLQSEKVDKEKLLYELNEIRLELNSKNEIDINKINYRLEYLEERIKNLESK